MTGPMIRIVVLIEVIVAILLSLWFAFSLGQRDMKLHTKVVILDHRYGNVPFYGECADLPERNERACAVDIRFIGVVP